MSQPATAKEKVKSKRMSKWLSKPLALALNSAECNFRLSRNLHLPYPLLPTPHQCHATILNSAVPPKCLIQCDRPLIKCTCVRYVFITGKIVVAVTVKFSYFILQGECGWGAMILFIPCCFDAVWVETWERSSKLEQCFSIGGPRTHKGPWCPLQEVHGKKFFFFIYLNGIFL